jgi:hypothetical protein
MTSFSPAAEDCQAKPRKLLQNVALQPRLFQIGINGLISLKNLKPVGTESAFSKAAGALSLHSGWFTDRAWHSFEWHTTTSSATTDSTVDTNCKHAPEQQRGSQRQHPSFYKTPLRN